MNQLSLPGGKKQGGSWRQFGETFARPLRGLYKFLSELPLRATGAQRFFSQFIPAKSL